MHTVIASAAPLSDEFVNGISQAIAEYSFERDPAGALVVAPNHTDGGAKSGEAYYQLRRWQEASRSGGRAFDATSGFVLPSTALRAPDASWVSDERIDALRAEQMTGYWHVAPDVAIEIASVSDSWQAICRKIDAYIAAGTRYAVAVDPRSGNVYECGTSPRGFELDVARIVAA